MKKPKSEAKELKTTSQARIPPVVHRFRVGGHEGMIVVGLFNDGRPYDVFISMPKEDSTVGGMLDCISVLVSLSLQCGVPIEAIVMAFTRRPFGKDKFARSRDEKIDTSIIDYVFYWMGCQFVVGFIGQVKPTTGRV